MVLGYFFLSYFFCSKTNQSNSIPYRLYHISKKNMNENFVNLELFEIQLSFFHHGLGLLNFLYFITLFLFNSSKKRTFLKTLSILNYFRPNCLFLPWSWVIFLINAIQITSIQFNSIQINSIQFNSNQFCLTILQKRTFPKTLPIFNYFRTSCLFPPWSLVILFSLFDYPIS